MLVQHLHVDDHLLGQDRGHVTPEHPLGDDASDELEQRSVASLLAVLAEQRVDVRQLPRVRVFTGANPQETIDIEVGHGLVPAVGRAAQDGHRLVHRRFGEAENLSLRHDQFFGKVRLLGSPAQKGERVVNHSTFFG